MISFSSNVNFVDEYFDYTDYVIGLERAYEAFEDYIGRAFVNLEYSFESSDETENKSTFIQRLKKIWDSVVNFFTTAIKKLKEIIKKAWNVLFKSNYSKDSAMSKKVWVLYSWVTAIRAAYKKKEVPADTYTNILNTHMSEYLKAASGKDLSIKKTWTKIPMIDLEAFEFTDELQNIKRIQDFLTKLAGSNSKSAIIHATQRGKKADINQAISTGIPFYKQHKTVRSQPINYLASLISKMGKEIDLAQLKGAVNDAITFVKSQAKCILEWIKRVTKCMNDSHEINHGSKGILKIFKVPADVKKALENHYRSLVPGNSHPLSANSAIVYSATAMHDPRFKDHPMYVEVMSAIKGRLGGAANNSGFKNDPGKGMFKNRSAIFPADKVLNMSLDKVVFLFVHEFGHIYDNQSTKLDKNGKRVYTMDRAKNAQKYQQNYRDDPMENFANRAATKALPKLDGELSCVRSWVKKIQDEIKAYANKINFKDVDGSKFNSWAMSSTIDDSIDKFKNT